MTSHYYSQQNTLNSMTLKDEWIGKVVCKNYQIIYKINEGSFGKIYRALHLQKNEYFAVKIEKVNKDKKKIGETLIIEAKIMQSLKGETGFPRLYYYLQDGQKRTLVETLLGKNIDELHMQCQRKFSLKTVLMFMDQAVNRLEYLHNNKLIHRDIKPENFMIGLPPDEKTIYLIDFGLSMYIFDQYGQHLQNKEGQPMVGTARFTPICSHQGTQQNRASDLESLGYLAIYLLEGTLPWMNIEAKTKEEKFLQIGLKKMRTSPEALCAKQPQEFVTYFNYLFNLSFTQQPSYSFIKKIFRTLFLKNNYEFDCKYDWVIEHQQSQLTFKSEHLQQQIQVIPEISSSDQEIYQSQLKSSQAMMASNQSKRSNSVKKDQFQKSATLMPLKKSRKNETHKSVVVNQDEDNQLKMDMIQYLQDRKNQKNSLLSKSSNDEDNENLRFDECDEYFPYQQLDEKISQLQWQYKFKEVF